MKMFSRIRISALAIIAALVVSVPALAQTTVTTTTLSAAVSANTQSIPLASATGVTVGSGLFVDRESMSVVSITGTVARVVRGVDGSGSVSHASGATVYVGPTSGVAGPGPFWQSDPAIGSCTASAEQYSVRINTNSGRIWGCINSRWAMVNQPYPQTVDIFNGWGADIASATTIAPVSRVTNVTGNTNVVTITPPAACALGCSITLIPIDASTWSTTTAGNIQLATTGVRYKALTLTWNPATSKWYPSY